MIEEIFTDAERMRLISLAMGALVSGPDDEATALISKLSGTDTVLIARRAYASRAQRKADQAI